MDLPPHIHMAQTAVIRKRIVNLDDPAVWSRIIVWSDRPYLRCPRCRQTVNQTADCPAVLDSSTGEAVSVSQEHGCGEWLRTRWVSRHHAQDVPAAAEALAKFYADDVANAYTALLSEMMLSLHVAKTRLQAPLRPGETLEERESEVTTGSDIQPGIYKNEGRWIVWDYHPESAFDRMVTLDFNDL